MQQYLDTAITAAKRAGQLIAESAGGIGVSKLKANSHDLLTEIDPKAEKIIKEILLSNYPSHKMLGEEQVAPGTSAADEALAEVSESEYLWVVDPLDGTTNFVHNLRGFTVSIALAVKGVPTVGVVYEPVGDELFTAIRGQGAFLNGKPIGVSNGKTLEESLMATGFPTDTVRALPIDMKGLNAIAPKSRNVRSLGSAALHLCYVACGRLTGYWEINLNAWDLAAGCLMVAEAGGSATDTLGRPYNLGVRNVLATNGLIHGQVVEALKDAGGTGFEE